MDLNIDEFYEKHRPKKLNEFILNKKALESIEKEFMLGKSFAIVSDRSGVGKHEIVNILLKNEKSLMIIDENSTINNMEICDETSFDMNAFLSNISSIKKESIFLIEEHIIKNESYRCLLNASFKLKKQRIYLYTTKDIKNDRKIKLIQKNVSKIINITKTPNTVVARKIHKICSIHFNTISNKSAVYLAKIVHGNLRFLLRCMYNLLNRTEQKNSRIIKKSQIVDVMKKSYMDNFQHFNDITDRCSDKLYDTETKMTMFSNKSYALNLFCHNSVFKKSTNPWSSKKIDIDRLSEISELFSFMDTVNITNDDQVSYLLLI